MRTSFLFRHREFGLYWVGMLLVNLAVQIEAITIGWQIYTLGRVTLSIEESAFLVGMVGLAQFLPLMALTLYAGSVADRGFPVGQSFWFPWGSRCCVCRGWFLSPWSKALPFRISF